MTRWIGRAATVGLVAAFVVWALALRPIALGGSATYIVIRGTSMLPLYETGDLVIARAQDTYGLGDIVAYRVPAGQIGAGHVVVHRIVGGDGAAGFRMEGDNNPNIDPWMPHASDILGTAWVHVPAWGRLIALLHQPAALGALAAAIAVAWIVARPSGRKGPPLDDPREGPAARSPLRGATSGPLGLSSR